MKDGKQQEKPMKKEITADNKSMPDDSGWVRVDQSLLKI